MIQLRKLGHSDLEVSPIGLGVMQFAGGSGAIQAINPAIPEETRIEIVRTALEGGINWFDTAELFGAGKSEKYLTEALDELGEISQRAIIATKWSSYLRFAGNIKKTIQERLDKLSPYSIGLYQIHNPKSFSSTKAEMNAMADLVKGGKIRAVGVSNFNSDQMRVAQDTLEKRGLGLASNQVHYNLLNRKIEYNGVLETARDLGISLIAWAPLASGILTGKFHKNPEKLTGIPAVRRKRLEKQLEDSWPVIEVLDEIASKYGSEPAQVALAWLIHQGEDIVAIPGATRIGHVMEGFGAMNLQLSEQDLTQLDQASL
ncbi:MAG: aldo/keto reductase [Chloroflexota bacterium]|nr:MAG: aldo/keto reductase [Chloroflexota bacterium]